jgi:hypothetical protein
MALKIALLYSKRRRKIVSSGFWGKSGGLFSITILCSSIIPSAGAFNNAVCSVARSLQHRSLSIV